MFDLKELSANENVTYKITEDGTLTIRDVKHSDNYSYCCQESSSRPELCWENQMKLHIADLQVKVFPATEGQKVTLMCTTSCPLTESPAAFIWYKNRKFVYEDWSPWYQELVSSDQAVRYSCAIKGYEDLRAPEVSVAFINPDCFGVTYPKAEVCPKELKSADQPCSITYPREVRVEMISEKDFTTLTCNTSCPASDSHTAFRWYWNRKLFMDCTNQHITVFKHFAYISCAVENNEYLHSDDICKGPPCRNINYVSRRFCMLEGSSVNISSKYSKPSFSDTTSESWHKLKRNMKEADVTTIEAKGRVEHYRVDENQHTLRINNLRKNDSGEYMFRLSNYKYQQPDLLEVILVVTGSTLQCFHTKSLKRFVPVSLVCDIKRLSYWLVF
ncbi:hypothetical protein AMECASPLE_006028 [Ameca splendens]|uniref:Ig-like domain-containing protein n=1 Tax=Ameca splendens TaxID=208324 RepID=A0ABV0ZK32_9TELE